MLYIYRTAASDGARDLAEALEGRQWRDKVAPLSSRVRSGDFVVFWGQRPFTLPTGVYGINNTPLTNKLADAERLAAAGVPTVTVSRTRPQPTTVPAASDPAFAAWQAAAGLAEDFINDEVADPVLRSAPRLRGVDELRRAVVALSDALQRPAPVAVQRDAGEWIGRDLNHVGGSDLLTPVANPGYWVRRENLVREFRVHSFRGRSLRAGIKAPRTDFAWTRRNAQPHPWVRAWDGGWRISYDGVSSTQAHRDIAHRAVVALGLDFGAVDIGERADGSLIVLEVNRAPGLEGGTVDAYARAIQSWVDAPTAPPVAPRPEGTRRRRQQ